MGMIQYIVHILLFNTPLKHDFNVDSSCSCSIIRRRRKRLLGSARTYLNTIGIYTSVVGVTYPYNIIILHL